ncbi:MAG: hypothetical protein ACLGHO_03115 [Gammaproteobacteria bacterium]
MKRVVAAIFIAAVTAVPAAYAAGSAGGHAAGHQRHPHAARRDPGVNHRQQHQRSRIHQGAHSGELTKDEIKSLAQEQKSIRQQERAYKSDGKLTKDERKDMHQDLNQASKNIYNEKHDAEKR